MRGNETQKYTLIIGPGISEKKYWYELTHYKDLFLVLAWRDIAVRYKQTTIGIVWVLLQPLITMIVFTLVFGKIAKLPSVQAVPYALMVYVGMLPWQLIATSLLGMSNSLINNSNLISKVYFPRLIVPLSSMVVALIDFLISLAFLIALMVWYQYIPGWQLLSLPFFLMMAILTSMGPGLLISALNVKYRDFRYIIPFIVQLGLYVSPIGFSSNIVPDEWRLLYYLNPAVSVIDGFRWCILGGETIIYMPGLFLGWIVILLCGFYGFRLFRKMENNFADTI